MTNGTVMLNRDRLAPARDELRATAAKSREVARNLLKVAGQAKLNCDGAIERGAEAVAASLTDSATAMDQLAAAMDELTLDSVEDQPCAD